MGSFESIEYTAVRIAPKKLILSLAWYADNIIILQLCLLKYDVKKTRVVLLIA